MKIVTFGDILNYCSENIRDQIDGMTQSHEFSLPEVLQLSVLSPRERLYIVARPEYLPAEKLFDFASDCIRHAYHYYGDLFPDNRVLLDSLDKITRHVKDGRDEGWKNAWRAADIVEDGIRQIEFSLADYPDIIKNEACARLESARWVAEAVCRICLTKWSDDYEGIADIGLSAFYTAQLVAKADTTGEEAEWQVGHLCSVVTGIEKDWNPDGNRRDEDEEAGSVADAPTGILSTLRDTANDLIEQVNEINDTLREITEMLDDAKREESNGVH